ncbi:hypothetical protein [Schleiferilactobacillus harbinensis]|uniref:Holin n=1 Tax=Schleiferilactobacillus harbinensis TaxID=304207 RepID=A0ABU7SZZ4_9LACO
MNPATMQEIVVFNGVVVLIMILIVIALWAKNVQRILRGPVWWVVLAVFLLYWLVTGVRVYLNPVPSGLVQVAGMGMTAFFSMLTIRFLGRPRQAK